MPTRLATTLLLAFAGLASAQVPRPQPRLLHVTPPGGRAGSTAEVTVGGEAIDGANGLWFSDPGLSAAPVPGTPRTFRVSIKPDAPLGNHDVRALTPDGLTNPRTFVVGALPESNESEPNDAPRTAAPIAVGRTVNGTLLAGDVDDFAFDGRALQRVFIGLHAERIDSPLDATVHLFDAEGIELAESRDAAGADPFLDVTLPADGRYVVTVHDVTYAGSPAHVYRLTVRDGPHLDAASPPIAGPVGPVGLTLIGRKIGRASLPREALSTSLDVTAWSGPPTFHPASDLPVNALGVMAAVRAFPIRVGTKSDPSGPILVAEAEGPIVREAEPNGPATPQVLTPPCSVGGSFAARRDVDAYRFPARKGDVWRIEAVSEGIGSFADPTLVVQRVPDSGDPEDLASADDTPDPGLAPRFNLATRDAGLRWVAPADGTYQILLNDAASTSRGDPALTYRLTIRRERPDVRLVVVPKAINALDALTLRRGGRASAVVLAWRIDGYAGPVLVRAEGLPAGVRCDPVVIPAGSNAAPIVLEADASAGPTVGVARVVGLVATDPMGRPETVPPDAWHGPARREAIPGTILRPPATIPGVTVKVTPARAARGFAVAVRDGSPLLLSATARTRDAVRGGRVEVDVEVVRRGGVQGPITLSLLDPPAGWSLAPSTLGEGESKSTIGLPIPAAAVPGPVSLVLKATASHQAAPSGPTYRVEEPSNPVILTVTAS